MLMCAWRHAVTETQAIPVLNLLKEPLINFTLSYAYHRRQTESITSHCCDFSGFLRHMPE